MEIEKTNDIIKLTKDESQLGLMLTNDSDLYWNMYTDTDKIKINQTDELYCLFDELYIKLYENPNYNIKKYTNKSEFENIMIQSCSKTFPLNFINISKEEDEIIITIKGNEFFKTEYSNPEYNDITNIFIENYISIEQYYKKNNIIKKRQ